VKLNEPKRANAGIASLGAVLFLGAHRPMLLLPGCRRASKFVMLSVGVGATVKQPGADTAGA